MKDKLLTLLLIIALVIAIITFSIGLPIYFRPFYYAQIEPLDIPDMTGYTAEQIREGYDEVLDYLTRPGGNFSAGVFRFSEEGASHFADCKGLFNLNLAGFLISSSAIVLLAVLWKKGKVKFTNPLRMHPVAFSGVATLSLFALIGGVAALDFDTAFVVFHSIFFPGKDNWLFDPGTDEIILAMPEEFFMNCAILILSSIIILSVLLIVFGTRAKRARTGK